MLEQHDLQRRHARLHEGITNHGVQRPQATGQENGKGTKHNCLPVQNTQKDRASGRQPNAPCKTESNLVAAHHKLVYIEQKMREDESAYFKTWNQYDWEFHAALVSACGSQLHRHYHKQIFDQFRQYVLLELNTYGFRGNGIIDEHEAILEAALKRDADACAAALERHLSFYHQRSLNT